MHPRNRWFIAFSLIYAVVGGALGVWQILWPGALPGLPARAHGHLMLLGFVAMMIYGVALHTLPRFANKPLYSERLANVQLVLANAGLVVLVVGWIGYWGPVRLVGGGLAWLAMVAFAYNIYRSVAARPSEGG